MVVVAYDNGNLVLICCLFKQKTAYEVRISDWSSDVCSSDRAGLPPGVLNVIHGGPDIANGLCEHPDIKAISFIGSTHVGTEIYRRATGQGKRCQAGMGAKNHCVIMPDRKSVV